MQQVRNQLKNIHVIKEAQNSAIEAVLYSFQSTSIRRTACYRDWIARHG
jgi:hypothetical protein